MGSLKCRISKIESTEDISEKELFYKDLFTKEKAVASYIMLFLAFCFVVLLMSAIFYIIWHNRTMFSDNRQLHDAVNKASIVIDSELSVSPLYKKLCLMSSQRKRVGVRLTEAEWTELDMMVNRVYAGFRESLFNRYNMISPSEYRICMLVKLDMPVSFIGLLTNMSSSSVTNVRTRLYKKLFGVDGTARDTDKFIRSL